MKLNPFKNLSRGWKVWITSFIIIIILVSLAISCPGLLVVYLVLFGAGIASAVVVAFVNDFF